MPDKFYLRALRDRLAERLDVPAGDDRPEFQRHDLLEEERWPGRGTSCQGMLVIASTRRGVSMCECRECGAVLGVKIREREREPEPVQEAIF